MVFIIWSPESIHFQRSSHLKDHLVQMVSFRPTPLKWDSGPGSYLKPKHPQLLLVHITKQVHEDFEPKCTLPKGNSVFLFTFVFLFQNLYSASDNIGEMANEEAPGPHSAMETF